MAALREVPFGLYYGSVDATPLFVMLAGLYAERTGDDATIVELWPAIEAALAWIDGPGDPDGDGFIEYYRATEQGLANQGWKDSQDAIFHADGQLGAGPDRARGGAGLCLLRQAASRRVAPSGWDAATARGRLKAEAHQPGASDSRRASGARSSAPMRWRSTATKEPCRVRTSNAGQVLFTGIAKPDAGDPGRPTACCAPQFFSGWGIRTVAQYGGALQSDVLSQRLDLAARQRADRPRLGPLRPQALGRARVQRLVRCRDLYGAAAIARAVLRLSAQPRTRADPLSGRLLAAGLGERHSVHADRGLARAAIRSGRRTKSACAIRDCRRSWTSWCCAICSSSNRASTSRCAATPTRCRWKSSSGEDRSRSRSCSAD